MHYDQNLDNYNVCVQNLLNTMVTNGDIASQYLQSY